MGYHENILLKTNGVGEAETESLILQRGGGGEAETEGLIFRGGGGETETESLILWLAVLELLAGRWWWHEV